MESQKKEVIDLVVEARKCTKVLENYQKAIHELSKVSDDIRNIALTGVKSNTERFNEALDIIQELNDKFYEINIELHKSNRNAWIFSAIAYGATFILCLISLFH